MELNDFLPYQLSVLSLKISKGIAAHYQDQFGINISEWRVLVILYKNPDITAKKIAQLSEMDKVRISRTLKTLVEKDYLTQQPHPLDARAKNYELNQRGKYLMRAVIPDALRYEEDLMSQLSTEEREQLQHLIGKFNRILG
ncbi:MarR family transcriptional regulator [Marinicella sp. S1101]|uniref:MarR family winged helix-turn-helix transcriptional regulator n=1 Tax=Marinicella marina TaxID=2996016 RepID=UPI002260AB5C|nr:MarR family transcriptional regulator [Marinicella marina]MCX7553758.1 MarR family transcriptional regulator [Marinicella marina]MDJ1140833.1 MarR family transcriptional regulator [Marinicella marina]